METVSNQDASADPAEMTRTESAGRKPGTVPKQFNRDVAPSVHALILTRNNIFPLAGLLMRGTPGGNIYNACPAPEVVIQVVAAGGGWAVRY